MVINQSLYNYPKCFIVFMVLYPYSENLMLIFLVEDYKWHIISNINKVGMGFALNINMIYLVIYIVLSMIIALFAINRRVSAVKVVFMSLIFTPLVGLLFVAKADRNIILRHYSATKYCKTSNKKVNAVNMVCPECGSRLDVEWELGMQ